jgi:hypothetical protein
LLVEGGAEWRWVKREPVVDTLWRTLKDVNVADGDQLCDGASDDEMVSRAVDILMVDFDDCDGERLLIVYKLRRRTAAANMEALLDER